MNFAIENCTQYLVLAGSHSYGCNTTFSDFDLRGWAVPPKEYFYSFHLNFEQADSPYEYEKLPRYWKYRLIEYAKNVDCRQPVQREKIECTVYSLKKFMKLAADCNPNIIELLFVDDEEILVQSKFGKLLRDNANLFLSTRAKYSFSGYAVAQLKRIESHRRWLLDPPKKKPKRSDFGLPDKPLISNDQYQAARSLIEKQVRLWMLEEAEVDKSVVSLVQDDIKTLIAHIIQNKENVNDAIEKTAGEFIGISNNYIDIIQREKNYRRSLAMFNQYQDWLAHRNPKRAELEKQYGYDTKHAMHLVRLLLEAKEILEKGKLVVKDKERSKLLQEIRTGHWKYSQLMEWAQQHMEVLDKLYPNNGVVPSKPNMKELDKLYQHIVEEALYEQKSTPNAYYWVDFG